MNVIPLHYNGPSVESVAKGISEQVPELRSIIAVTVTNEGRVDVWCSGLGEDAPAAALLLDDYAKAVLRGDVVYEDSGPESGA